MKKGFVGLLAALALVLGTMAYAAPQPLTNADLDQVVAGESTASGPQAVAVDGDDSTNVAAGALADNAAQAVNGIDNTTTQNPDNSAVSSTGGLSINSEESGVAAAVAADALAAYSDNPTDSAVAVGHSNDALNASNNSGEVSTAAGNGIALSNPVDSAIAQDHGFALENNGEVANANNGSIAFANPDDTALAYGEGSVAIEDPSDVANASGHGNVAFEDPNDVANANGVNNIALEDPGDVALALEHARAAELGNNNAVAFDNAVAVENPDDIAIARENGLAIADNEDAATVIGNHDIAVKTDADAALATEGSTAIEGDEIAIATENGIAVSNPTDLAVSTGSGTSIESDGDLTVAIAHGSQVNHANASHDSAVAMDDSHATNASNNHDSPVAIGNDNTAVNNKGAQYSLVATDHAVVKATENEIENTDVIDGSTVLIGNGNHASAVYDDATIEVEAEDDEAEIFGVVAKTADICGSFNVDETETTVEATIEESFNTETNAMKICGQDAANAIALVSTLGDAQSGINLNVTSATTTVPSVSSASTPGVTAGISSASTTLTQAALNDSSNVRVNFN